MDTIKIRALGVGALEIKIGARRLLVDAINSINTVPELFAGDTLLFTHDDADHFNADSFPQLKKLDITIIGPPSIIKPIIENDIADLEQIKIMYSQTNYEPCTLELDGFRIKSFQTTHFLNWRPVHNSYLLEIGDNKIYLTGDNYLTKEMSDILTDIDVVICNLVDEGFIKGYEDPRFAIHHHMSYLLNIISTYSPKRIIGSHLINFPGTVKEEDMKKLVENYQFSQITIPISTDEIILV